MKKIIVPVDFSKCSENALKTASFIAKKSNAEILVVHMLELSSEIKLQSGTHKQQEILFFLKLAENKLKQFIQKDYLEDVKVTWIVEYYTPLLELEALAKEAEADLIVMGSHGVSGIKELFVGSNTEKVVRSSAIPVLVVKNVPVVSDFKTAIFASDFSIDEIESYKRVKSMLKKLSCNLQLLHVNTPYKNFRSTREMEQEVSDFLMEAEGDLHSINDVVYISDYTVEKGILEYANLYGMDLIIVATHGRKGISHFLEGSISEDVANHSTLPVMTFKM